MSDTDRDTDTGALVLQIEGFEGPLDMLLTLARAQKVDLTRISILALVEQYLAFMQAARRLRLELAADYLVMAAWLAYLKSRLLIPVPPEADDEPSAEELALRLHLRLQRLEAMREAGHRLMARDRLGRDVFPRGNPEGLHLARRGRFDLDWHEFLGAYGGCRERTMVTELRIERRPVMALDDAIERLSNLIGDIYSWSQLVVFLPETLTDPRYARSALASNWRDRGGPSCGRRRSSVRSMCVNATGATTPPPACNHEP